MGLFDVFRKKRDEEQAIKVICKTADKGTEKAESFLKNLEKRRRELEDYKDDIRKFMFDHKKKTDKSYLKENFPSESEDIAEIPFEIGEDDLELPDFENIDKAIGLINQEMEKIKALKDDFDSINQVGNMQCDIILSRKKYKEYQEKQKMKKGTGEE